MAATAKKVVTLKPRKKAPGIDEKKKLDAINPDFSECKTNRDRRYLHLNILERLIPQAVDAYEAKPSSANGYSLTNMMSSHRELMGELESTFDFEVLSEMIVSEIINPFIDSFVKTVGKDIANTTMAVKTSVPVANRKKVDSALIDLLRQISYDMEQALNKLSGDISDQIKEFS